MSIAFINKTKIINTNTLNYDHQIIYFQIYLEAILRPWGNLGGINITNKKDYVPLIVPNNLTQMASVTFGPGRDFSIGKVWWWE